MLANALGQLGCDVRCSPRGVGSAAWSDPQFRVERFRGVTAALWTSRASRWWRARAWTVPAREDGVGWATSVVRECALVIGIRAARRGCRAHLVRRTTSTPSFVAAFGGTGRIVHYSLHLPPGGDAPVTSWVAPLTRGPSGRRRARRRAGGGIRLAVASDESCAAWSVRGAVPRSRGHSARHEPRRGAGRRPARTARHSGGRDASRSSSARSRREGSGHRVARVPRVARLDSPGRRHHGRAVPGMERNPRWAGRHRHRRVRRRSDPVVAYSAADLVVISFRDGFVRDSGVLRDALDLGAPRRLLERERIRSRGRALRARRSVRGRRTRRARSRPCGAWRRPSIPKRWPRLGPSYRTSRLRRPTSTCSTRWRRRRVRPDGSRGARRRRRRDGTRRRPACPTARSATSQPTTLREHLVALVHVDDRGGVRHDERRLLRTPHDGPAVHRAVARALLPREVARSAVAGTAAPDRRSACPHVGAPLEE